MPANRCRAALSACLALVLWHCTADTPHEPRTSSAPAVGRAGAGGSSAASASAGTTQPPRPPPIPPPPVPPAPPPPPSTTDEDKDGWTAADGDCEDASPQLNPGAYDFPGNGHDEDCQGGDATPAEESCDAIALDSRDPRDGARAIGLCRFVTEASKQWGVLDARFVEPDGSPRDGNEPMSELQTGILPAFGVVTPRAGASMLALSSGVARAPAQPGYTSDCDMISFFSSDPPEGYPRSPASCGLEEDLNQGFDIFDAVALELKIRVPTNAKSFAFDSNFYTYEFPNFICNVFNDFFVALLDPKPVGLPDANIVFDQDGNPVSVNNSLLQVCEPGTHGDKMFRCPQGPAQLEGTGFNGEASCAEEAPGWGGVFGGGRGPTAPKNAATGWLNTTAPVQPGSILTLRFAIWDTGDAILDSLALVDHFTWSVETPIVIETKPVVPQ